MSAAADPHLYLSTGIAADRIPNIRSFPLSYQFTVTGATRKAGPSHKLGVSVTVNGTELVLFRLDKLVFAFSRRCVHMGGDMALADIEDVDGTLCISCPSHHFCFSLVSGESRAPEGHQQPAFPARVNEHGIVHVGFAGLAQSMFDNPDF